MNPLFQHPGKTNRQLNFESVYLEKQLDFYPLILEAHEKTVKDAARESPEFINGLFWPQTMNRNMVGFLTRKYGKVVALDEEGRTYVRLAENVRLYFKKLDDKFRPKNIPTGHVLQLNTAQGQLFGRDITVLYAGPKLRKPNVWDEIDCYLIEMWNQSQVHWVSDLSDLSQRMNDGSNFAPIFPVTPPSNPSQQTGLIVRVKGKADGNSGQASGS